VVLERPALGGGPANLLESRPARTDGEGRFLFEGVSRDLCAVQVRGLELGVSGFRRELGTADDVERLELAVPLRAHVQIDAGAQAAFDRVSLLDARGARLPLSVEHGGHAYVTEEIALDQGRSEAFSVSELAATLVLLADGREVRRAPVALVRGELNMIRP
jgi:hypothetical protein